MGKFIEFGIKGLECVPGDWVEEYGVLFVGGCPRVF